MKIENLLLDQLTPITIYQELKGIFSDELVFLFESVVHTDLGNYSFFFIGAHERVAYKNEECVFTDENGKKNTLDKTPFEFLKEYYSKLDFNHYKNLIEEHNLKFADGFVGYIGYDSIMLFEPSLKSYMSELKDEINIPDIDLIRPKIVCSYAHKTNTFKVFTLHENFYDKVDLIVDELKKPTEYLPLNKIKSDAEGKFCFDEQKYHEFVNRAKEHILDGDVFQLLVSNRYTYKDEVDPFSFYRVLRSKNPSPYMFYLAYEDFSIVGSSPEVMIKLQNDKILLRPIAGTRRRGKDKAHDIKMENELLNDEKEKAEHLMLIDLGRNDIGRVSKPGSVKVNEMMRIERFSHVIHMVSDIEGELDKKYDMFDLFAATFTAGTMTGTPKIKAMELIAKFEKLKRSFYSGVVGYFGFDNSIDSAIMIRTAYIDKEKTIFQAGGGVVADSKPKLEFLEVKNKLGAMTASLEELKK